MALAKSLAQTNTQLREAFDALSEHRDELEAAHGLLLAENTSQRERLSLLELTLAMESYPTAAFDSMQARVEAQLRAAAQEVVALRTENAALKDQLAMHPELQPPPTSLQQVQPKQQQQRTPRAATAVSYTHLTLPTTPYV